MAKAHDDKRDEDNADATARMLPCPSCEETDVDATYALGAKVGGDRYYQAGCMVCGMTGPESHTRRDSADRWNALPRRTIPSHALPIEEFEKHLRGEPTMLGHRKVDFAPSTTPRSGETPRMDRHWNKTSITPMDLYAEGQKLERELAEAQRDRELHRQAAHEADMRTQAAVRSEKAALSVASAIGRNEIIEECAAVADYLYENGANTDGSELLVDCSNKIRDLKNRADGGKETNG